LKSNAKIVFVYAQYHRADVFKHLQAIKLFFRFSSLLIKRQQNARIQNSSFNSISLLKELFCNHLIQHFVADEEEKFQRQILRNFCENSNLN
jgi:hypothetical protein